MIGSMQVGLALSCRQREPVVSKQNLCIDSIGSHMMRERRGGKVPTWGYREHAAVSSHDKQRKQAYGRAD